MKQTGPAALEKIIVDAVSRHQTGSAIVAVYLFGSGAAGRRKKGSDVDLAFLLDEKAYRSDPVNASAPAYLAAAEIGQALDCETDVTVLNAASLEMAYEIITTGRRIMVLNEDRVTDYEIARKGMYYDFKPFLDGLRSKCMAKVRGG